MKRNRLLIGIVACSISLSLVLSNRVITGSAAVTDFNGNKAPVNPDFINYQKNKSSSAFTIIDASGKKRILGEVPAPLKLPDSSKSMASEASFPSSFDLRTSGKVSSVKDQSFSGSCWAFATYGSLESNLLPTERRDFSENNLKNNSGFSYDPNYGGNDSMSTAYLARWSGPINESDDPYNPSSTSSPIDKTVQKHIQEVLFIPGRTGPWDNSTLKSALMTYGAIYTTMRWDNNCYNSTNKTYYKSNKDYINHAVTIVGWDENFDRNKFLDNNTGKMPAGNGAFIIKNSWGTSFGENGYFYISFYDASAFFNNSVFNGAEDSKNYSRVYQYDPLGWVQSFGFTTNTDTAWFANVFTASSNEELSAVSFYTPVVNSGYSVYVSSNYTGTSSLNSRTLKGSGVISLPGYHTIKLNSTETLTAGKNFAVIVKLTTPGYGYPIPVERSIPGYSDAASSNSGESFCSSDSFGASTSWEDIHSVDSSANVCLKAFTKPSANTTINPVRYGGIDRFETAAKVSASGWATSANVVLVNGQGFADALIGVPFAHLKDAPILLTNADYLPDFTNNEIARLEAKNIYILGGTGVVSAALENSLKAKG
ncbi:MAG: lectin like domain-containing protein, partial [Clostridiaceae bacterium]